MNDFEIRKQTKLPLSKCVELVTNGIRFRLFRASVTVAIVALAVAFLMTILCDSLIGRQVSFSVGDLVRPRQILLFWISRLSAPITETEVAKTVVSAEPGSARWEEFKDWGKCGDAELERLADAARRERKYLRFFAGIGEGKRRAIVDRATDYDLIRALCGPEAFGKLEASLPSLGRRLPGTIEDLRDFLALWSDTMPLRARIIDGHRNALARVSTALDKKAVQDVIADLDEETLTKFNSAGFRLARDEMETLREEGRMNADTHQIASSAGAPLFKQRFAVQYGVKDLNTITPDMVLARAASRRGAQWVTEVMRHAGIELGLSAERVRSVARHHVRCAHLAEVESSLLALEEGTGLLGFSNRVLWLVVVSMLVCIVGIANAMLMSVTERFKEIATMKCLGATDGFIMAHFMIESGLQGFAGGIMGGTLGLVLGILRSSAGYGSLAFLNLPIPALLLAWIVSIFFGVLLSMIAAIYPAWVAARLAPMEAMRVE